jgi:hypothetical protein
VVEDGIEDFVVPPVDEEGEGLFWTTTGGFDLFSKVGKPPVESLTERFLK